jgi:hypothetical protein
LSARRIFSASQVGILGPQLEHDTLAQRPVVVSFASAGVTLLRSQSATTPAICVLFFSSVGERHIADAPYLIDAVASSINWLDSGAPDAETAITNDVEISRRIARQEAEKYERMMRENPGEYWGSQANQDRYRDALALSLGEGLVGEVEPEPSPPPAEAAPASAVPPAGHLRLPLRLRRLRQREHQGVIPADRGSVGPPSVLFRHSVANSPATGLQLNKTWCNLSGYVPDVCGRKR